MKITEVLAIYAACLSTLVFLWNISKATPEFKVDLIHGLEEKGDEYIGGLYITVRNPSSHKIHLAGLDLLYQSEKSSILKKLIHLYKYKNWSGSIGWVHCILSHYDINDKCPTELDAGQSHRVFVPEDTINKIIGQGINRKIRAKAQDQLWRDKYSKPLEY